MADLIAVPVKKQKTLDVLVDPNAIQVCAVNLLLKQASKHTNKQMILILG